MLFRSKIYAVSLKAQGASYTATKEEFIAGQPLPLTDLVVNPKDQALYFTVGGRKVQGGLYRVIYTGNESTAPSQPNKAGAEARAQRHQLARRVHAHDAALRARRVARRRRRVHDEGRTAERQDLADHLDDAGLPDGLHEQARHDVARALLGEDAVRRRSFLQAHGSSTPQNRVTESKIFDTVAAAFGIEGWPVTAINSPCRSAPPSNRSPSKPRCRCQRAGSDASSSCLRSYQGC